MASDTSFVILNEVKDLLLHDITVVQLCFVI